MQLNDKAIVFNVVLYEKKNINKKTGVYCVVLIVVGIIRQ